MLKLCCGCFMQLSTIFQLYRST